MAAKNEHMRMASQLRKGMEVQYRGGEWAAITEHWYFKSPLRVVSITTADGKRHSFAPRDRVMSRVPREDGDADR